MSKTAGIVIIGNEVLSGKTRDTNSHFFCTELRQLGVEVQKISTIQDDIEIIGREAAVSVRHTTMSPSKASPTVWALKWFAIPISNSVCASGWAIR